MKIAVVAANGRVAQKVIKEALDRGFEVKAFGRDDENKTVAKDYVKKDIMDLTKDDIAGFDAVVDASADRRRCRFSLCKSRAHRTGQGRSRLPRYVPSSGKRAGRGARRAAQEK